MNDTNDNSMEVLFHLPQYLFNLVDPSIKFKKLQTCLNKNSLQFKSENNDSNDHKIIRKKFVKLDNGINPISSLSKPLNNEHDIKSDNELVIPFKRKLAKISCDDKSVTTISKNESYEKTHPMESKIPVKQRKVAEVQSEKDIYFTRVWREAKRLEHVVKRALNEVNVDILPKYDTNNKENQRNMNSSKTVDLNNSLSSGIHVENNSKLHEGNQSEQFNSKVVIDEDKKSIAYSQDTFEECSESNQPVKNKPCINVTHKSTTKKPMHVNAKETKLPHKILIDAAQARSFMQRKKKEHLILKKQAAEEVKLSQKHIEDKLHLLALKQKEVISKAHKRPVPTSDDEASSETVVKNLYSTNKNINETSLAKTISLNKDNKAIYSSKRSNIIVGRDPFIVNTNHNRTLNLNSNKFISNSVMIMQKLRAQSAHHTYKANSENSDDDTVDSTDEKYLSNTNYKKQLNGLINVNQLPYQFVNDSISSAGIHNVLLPEFLKHPEVGDNFDKMTPEQIIQILADYNGISVQDICSNFEKYSHDILAFLSKDKMPKIEYSSKIERIKILAEKLILRCALPPQTFIDDNYRDNYDENYKDNYENNHENKDYNYVDSNLDIENLLGEINDADLPGAKLDALFNQSEKKIQEKNLDASQILSYEIDPKEISQPIIMDKKIQPNNFNKKFLLKKDYISEELIKCPLLKKMSSLSPQLNFFNDEYGLKFKVDYISAEKIDPIKNIRPDPDNVINIMYQRKLALSLNSFESKNNEIKEKLFTRGQVLNSNDTNLDAHVSGIQVDEVNLIECSLDSKIIDLNNVSNKDLDAIKSCLGNQIINSTAINNENLDLSEPNIRNEDMHLNLVVENFDSKTNKNIEAVNHDVKLQNVDLNDNDIMNDELVSANRSNFVPLSSRSDNYKIEVVAATKDLDDLKSDLEIVMTDNDIILSKNSKLPSATDVSTSKEIETLSHSDEISNQSEISKVGERASKDILNKIIYPLCVKASPAELEARFIAELALLENMDVSSQQLAQLATTNEIAVCRNDVVTMAQILMKKEKSTD